MASGELCLRVFSVLRRQKREIERIEYISRMASGLGEACYHPQTKFAKVMFLHLPVSNSVHGGGGGGGWGRSASSGVCI